MFTRCPQCKTVHPVAAAQLSQARGLVQCGPCGRNFSALSFLFDDWPSGEAHRPPIGPGTTLPILEQATVGEVIAATVPAGVIETEPAATGTSRIAWGLAILLLVLVTMANLVWTFRAPLLDNPRISAWIQLADGNRAEEQGLLRDPQQIQLVSRDMHTHPTRSGILVLSLTLVNLASRSQVYPELEVTLMDAANQPVAQRRLQPAEYLRPGADTSAGLAADVYLPVLLELGDPGAQAVGFEIRFL